MLLSNHQQLDLEDLCQISSSQFSLSWGQWSTPQKLYEHKAFSSNLCTMRRYVSIKVLRQEFDGILSDLNIWLEQPGTEIQHSKNQVEVARFIDPYTIFLSRSIRLSGLAVKTSQSESYDVSSNLSACWSSLQSLGHFAWHRSRPWTVMRVSTLPTSL